MATAYKVLGQSSPAATTNTTLYTVDLFQNDPHWRDLILFNEYFHGDDGSGIGASHQTGWSAMVAKLISQLNRYSAV